MSVQEINYNSVASFERAKRGPESSTSLRMFTVLLMAVFFLVLMGGLAAGVTMYQHVAANQAETNAARMQSGLLASVVHTNDFADAVSVAEGPEGPALVLTREDPDGDPFEVRLYLHQGNIVQEYGMAGTAYNPARAQQLLATSTFDVQLVDDLVLLRTDQGATYIALRSQQGGAA